MLSSIRPHALLLCALLVALSLAACESDDAKFAAALASGQASAAAGEHAEAIIDFRNALKINPNDSEAHFALAESYTATGKTRDALWEYAEAVRLDPSSRKARLKLGALALVGQDYAQALEQGTAAAALAPDDPLPLILMGQAQQGLGQAEEAEKAFLKAVELAPEHGAVLYMLAHFYDVQGQRDRAEPVFVKLTEVEPDNFAFSALGRFLAEDPSRDEVAVAALRRAVELATPELRLASYENLARFFIARQRLEEAAEALQGGIAATKDAPDQRLELTQLLAEVLERQGKKDEATALLETAAKEAPDSSQAQLALASLRERNGDLVGAVEAAERAVKAAPDSRTAKLQLVEHLIEAGATGDNPGQIQEARGIVEAVLAKEPTDPKALYSLGRIQLGEKDVPGATKSFRASIDARPDSAPAHYMLGRALVGSGDTRGGRAEVARALELDPEMTVARRLLIQLHAALGEDEYAIDQGRLYLRRNPDPQIRMIVAQSLARLGRTHDALVSIDRIPEEERTIEFSFAKARLLQADGQPEAARTELLGALEKMPDNPKILRTLLQIDTGLGKPEEAGKRIEAALSREPNAPALIALRGDYALQVRDLETAEATFKRCLEVDPTNLEAFGQLARIYQQTNRLDEAVATYQDALAKQPDSAQLHNALGMILQVQGKTEAAVASYEKAIALDDKMYQAKNNLAYLLAESGSDLQRALDLAQEAKAQRPDDPGASDTLGWVLYRRGIPSAAVGYLREAVAGLEPGTAEMGLTRYHLAVAYEADDKKPLAIETLELSLADLEQQRSKARADGSELPDPEWSAPARQMLARLKQAG